MKDYPNFYELHQRHLPCPDNYGGCNFLDEYSECVVLLDGYCPACGLQLSSPEDDFIPPTPDECWEGFKRLYPAEYKSAQSIFPF